MASRTNCAQKGWCTTIQPDNVGWQPSTGPRSVMPLRREPKASNHLSWHLWPRKGKGQPGAVDRPEVRVARVLRRDLAEQRTGADALQLTLVPRFSFRARLSASVRRYSRWAHHILGRKEEGMHKRQDSSW